MPERFTLWLLDKLPLHTLTTALRRRGWVAVPRQYAEEAFPAQVETGWWPSYNPKIDLEARND